MNKDDKDCLFNFEVVPQPQITKEELRNIVGEPVWEQIQNKKMRDVLIEGESLVVVSVDKKNGVITVK